MRLLDWYLAVLGPSATAVNVVLSNDDGWAEKNIRTFYTTLSDNGNSVVLSAPALDKSGTGSQDAVPSQLSGPCEFNSCPSRSPATGPKGPTLRMNYVNSFPATAMRYGIRTFGPKVWGKGPDICVAGPNVGSNLGDTVKISGTVGATVEAVKNGCPGIAFSGRDGSQVGWNTPTQPYQNVYATLATKITKVVTASGKPYLPANVWLNVNFPSASGACASPSNYKFVLSRINSASGSPDVLTCNNKGRLPTESSVIDRSGCHVSISVGRSPDKGDASKADQAFVLNKLKSILSC